MTDSVESKVKFPMTAVLKVRTDMRALAGIAAYLTKVGDLPTSRNALGGTAIVILYNALVRSGAIEAVKSTEDAAIILERLGFTDLVTASMNRKDYGVQVSREDLQEDPEAGQKLADIIKQSLQKAKQG